MSEAISPETHKKRKPNHFIFSKLAEQEIIHFCQFYTHYSLQKKLVPSFANQISLWVNFLKFIKMFEHTKNTKTIFALIELIDLFFYKNNPKEIIKDEKMRK